MVSLMYVGAYIVTDRYIRRYMHLPSNLPTFARPPIYRAKIVSSSKKSRKPGCRARRRSASVASGFLEARASFISLFYQKIYKSCISDILARSRFASSTLFRRFSRRGNRPGVNRESPRFRADYSHPRPRIMSSRESTWLSRRA